MTPTPGKPRDFALTWIHSIVEGVPKETTHLIIKNPSPEDLENNVVHVIEKAAYDALAKRVAELEKTLREYEHECETINEMRAERDAAKEEVLDLRAQKDPELIDAVKGLALVHLKNDLSKIRASRDEVREELTAAKAEIELLKGAARPYVHELLLKANVKLTALSEENTRLREVLHKIEVNVKATDASDKTSVLLVLDHIEELARQALEEK